MDVVENINGDRSNCRDQRCRTISFSSFSQEASEMNNEPFFFQIIADNETATLFSLFAAILKWDEVVENELMAQVSDFENRQKEIPDWMWDRFNNKAFVLLDTKRAIFANFAVTVTTTVESFLAAICQFRSFPLVLL